MHALTARENDSEFEAVLALENDDIVSGDTADQLGEQMSLLAEKAFTVIGGTPSSLPTCPVGCKEQRVR